MEGQQRSLMGDFGSQNNRSYRKDVGPDVSSEDPSHHLSSGPKDSAGMRTLMGFHRG